MSQPLQPAAASSPAPERSLVWPGSDFEQKAQRRHEALDARAAAAMASGAAPSMNPKVWPCEDSLALHRLGEDEYLAAVADAHWGGASGVAVVEHLARAFTRARAETARDRLALALRGCDALYFMRRDRDDRSETTALLVHLAGRRLSWISVGDSCLFVLDPLRDRCLRKTEFPDGFLLPFLGSCPLASIPGSVKPVGGSVELALGAVVLLATDGIEPETSGLRREELPAFFREVSLAEGLEALLARGDDPERGGGRDNLALVALAGPS